MVVVPAATRVTVPVVSSTVATLVLEEVNFIAAFVFFVKAGTVKASPTTASAVVADMVECACNTGRNIVVRISEEKAQVSDCSQMVRSFFVRTTSSADAVEKVFGKVEYVASKVDGELAFVTGKMSEEAFDAVSAQVALVSRIRLLEA